MSTLARTGTAVAAVGSATAGGVLFAFSTFVMRALDAQPPREAIRTMQAINRFAPNPLFLAVFVGSAAVGVGATVASWPSEDRSGAVVRGVATLTYVIGLAVTAGYHVPRNERLARLDSAATVAADAWRSYSGGWTAMNHLRTVTSLVAAAGFAWSLSRRC